MLTGTATSTCPGVATPKKARRQFLIAGSGAEPAEGDPPNSTVVTVSPTPTLSGISERPDYQPVKEIRLSATSRDRWWSRRSSHLLGNGSASSADTQTEYERVRRPVLQDILCALPRHPKRHPQRSLDGTCAATLNAWSAS